MKWKFIAVLVCAFILAGSFAIFAEEGTYIVTLEKTVGLFSASETQERDYIVASAEELKEYLDAGIVIEYEPNYKVELFSAQWNHNAVDCDFAWELGCYGNGVIVGVIDSGLYPFEELEDNVIEGKNYLDGSTDTTDNIGHGTFVTGIIASESKGISYKSKIVPLKCFDAYEDTYVSTLLNAIYDAVNVYDCDVINMSFGIAGNSDTLNRAITYAVNSGVIVVAAVGNDGNNTIYYPAGYNNVIGVGSVNRYLEKSSFSQYNRSVFVTAPGERLQSLTAPGYLDDSGTSFAAPHVTALAAIARCIDKEITPSGFKSVLSASSLDLGEDGYDVYYGYGLINCRSFIDKMLEADDLFVSPINEEKGKKYSVIYNRSEKEQKFTAMCSAYNGNLLDKFFSVPLKLESGEIYRFENETSDGKIKYMFWDSLFNMKPIEKIRQAG